MRQILQKQMGQATIMRIRPTRARVKQPSRGMAVTSTDEYVQKISGFDGMKYATDVYTDVRNSIVNIDVEILDNLNDLFMNIY